MTPWRCEDCGLDLAIRDARRVLPGGHVLRPACPASASGLHRVSDEQLAARRAEARAEFDRVVGDG